ncbi:MAG: phosphotransferase, partial [Blastococcus sp.]
MIGGADRARYAPVRRLAELASTARNASRLAAGARLADGQALRSLPADAEAALHDARARFAVPPQWTVRGRLTTVADVAVLEVCDGDRLAAVLKLARTPEGTSSLRLQQETLQLLRGDARLGEWRRLLPVVLAHGTAGAHAYSIEAALPGTVGTDATAGAEAARNAVVAVSGLHRATGRAVVATRPVVDGWLEPALSLVADVPTLMGPGARRRGVEAIRERIRAGTEGRTVWLGHTHGDYAPGNLFLGPAADVVGIIDWGQARADDPAVIDVLTYLLVIRADAEGRGLGSVVGDLCRGAPLSEDELALLELHRAACPADELDVAVMALLAWLRHVENNLLKSPRYGANPAWVFLTVEKVLRT